MNEQGRLQSLNSPTRSAILAWADACGIDVDNESADTLVHRLHGQAIPFEGDPDVVERCVVEALHWMADRSEDGSALQGAAEVVAKAFEQAEFVGGAAHPEPASPEDADTTQEETQTSAQSPPRPMRHDIIYSVPVEVRLADGRRGKVAHPPFGACVRVKLNDGCTIMVALDDLPMAARTALQAAVRKWIEVHPRSSAPGCGMSFRGFLTTGGASHS